MELLALLIIFAFIGTLATQFGADSRPSEHDDRERAAWNDVNGGHRA